MRLRLTVDGRPFEADVRPEDSLLRVLRAAGCFAVKEGCGVGDCGACAVLIDGVAQNACLTFAVQAEGRTVTTAAGLGSAAHPHALQAALVGEGGVQCGFCIPGFLAGAASVLAAEGAPTHEDFKRGLDGHLCRCTGYENQKRALARATGAVVPSREDLDPLTVVGRSLPKIDAMGLACGVGAFVEDQLLPGTVRAKLLSSPHAHARITRIDASRARALPGVLCVLTHEDVPRTPYTSAGQGAPEPSPHDRFLLDRKVRYVGDRVALVAAESERLAEEALALIEVDYEVLPAVLDPRRSQDEGAPVIHDEPEAHAPLPIGFDKGRNRASHAEAEVGEPAAALAGAEVVVEGEYVSPVQAHASVEPHVCLGWLDEGDRVVLRTSTQVPFHARRITARALGVPERRIRIVKPRIGGGFGGKQEVILEPLVALLVLKTRRPVLLRYSREEEFQMGRTRHGQVVSIRLGARRTGELTAIALQVLNNTGAYGSHAHTVLCNGGSKSLPLYRCENVSFTGDSVYTNLPEAGAFRGYGAPQTYFALESAVDDLAARLGVDPLELRLRNAVGVGQGSPITEVLGEGREGNRQVIASCGLPECLRRGAEAAGWSRRDALPRSGRLRRGLGMAAMIEGSAIPDVDLASASIKMNEDGSFNLLMGATDLGQGSDTVLAQVAAEVLAVPLDHVVVLSSDTDVTPFDVGAYASSTTYLSGLAVHDAAQKVRSQILEVAAAELGVPAEGLRLQAGRVVAPSGASCPLSRVACRSLYETDQRQIAAFASRTTKVSPPPFAAQFAEVEVDVRTGVVRVPRFVCAVDCGRALNPTLARGQIHGAVVQGLGMALTEELLFDPAGRLLNANLSEYPVLRMIDSPDIDVLLVPTVEDSGPFGAKSIGEIGICGPVPAVANALFHATGVRLTRAPFTPERVLDALRRAGVGG